MSDADELASSGIILVVFGFGFFIVGMALKFITAEDVHPPATPPPKAPSLQVKRSAPKLRAIHLTDTCPICLSAVADGEGGISVLPCGHGLHETCWRLMLDSETACGFNCPVCRTPVV